MFFLDEIFDHRQYEFSMNETAEYGQILIDDKFNLAQDVIVC